MDSAPGDGVPAGVAPREKGQIWVHTAWQPFIPLLPGSGQWGTEWDREDEQHCRKIHTNNLIRPPLKISPSWDSSGRALQE